MAVLSRPVVLPVETLADRATQGISLAGVAPFPLGVSPIAVGGRGRVLPLE
jgi:hypothetical protein